MTNQEIITKIIIGVEKKSDYCFAKYDDETIGYVWQQYKFLKSIAPSNFSDESIIEDTINRIISQMFFHEIGHPVIC